MNRLIKQKKHEYKLIKTPFGNTMLGIDGNASFEKVQAEALYSLSWAHFIFDQGIFESEDFLQLLDPILVDEPRKETEIIKTDHCKVSIGWSHSLFVSDYETEEDKISTVNFYKVPIEISWGEWELVRIMNKNVDYSLYECYEMIDSKKFMKFGISQYKENIDKFYFFIQRVIETFDNLSFTVNPVQLKLISMQRIAWELDEQQLHFQKKLESLQNMVSYITERKRVTNARILNGILFMIAIFSIMDISRSIYEVLNNKDTSLTIVTFAPVTVIFIVMFLYKMITKD